MREQHTSPSWKKTQVRAKQTARGVKIFKMKKKISELVLYNIHAPHMGNSKISKITEYFYSKLNCINIPSKGKDLCIVGDLNAKVGKSDTKFINCIGSHSRGIRNTNGEHLCDLLMKNTRIARTFFEIDHLSKPLLGKKRKYHHIQPNRLYHTPSELKTIYDKCNELYFPPR